MPERCARGSAELSQRGMAGSSVARRLSAIRQFHRFMYLEGARPDDPTQTVDGPRRQRPLPRLLDQAEIEALIAAARQRAAGARPAPGRHDSSCSTPAGCAPRSWSACRCPRSPRTERFLVVSGQGRQGAHGAGGPGRRRGAQRPTWQCATAFLRPASRQSLPVPLARAPAATSPDSAWRSCCSELAPEAGHRPRTASRRTSCVMPLPAICSPAAPICARCS